MGRPTNNNNNGYTEKLPSSRRSFWGYDYEKSKHQSGGSVVSKKTIGTGRTERSGKARWSNQEIIDQRDNFTPQEEELLIKLHATIGARWTIIAQQLPGRGEGEVKNVWNTKLKKKLTAMGIDPVTHKPFSQILSDYLGNVAPAYNCYSSPASATQLHPPHFNTTLKTTIMTNYTEPHPPQDGDCFRPMANAGNYTDLLSELQAIKSIANYTAPGPTPPSPPPSSSSSSLSPSTSSLITSSPALLLPTTSCRNNNNQEIIMMNNDSSSSAVAAAAAAGGFSWSDFLVEDAFLPGGGEGPQEEQDDDCCRISSLNDVVPRLEAASSSSSTSSSSSSFVEAMLSREEDNMLLLDFPGLSEEPFYY